MPYDYKQAQNSWFNAAPGTKIDDWAKANLGFAEGITSGHNGEFMNLPGGESFDAVRDIGGANAPIWGSQDYNYETGQKYTPQESIAAEQAWAQKNGVAWDGSGGGVPPPRAGGGGSSSSGYGTTAQRDALYNTLMGRASQSLNINPQTDANIRTQADPYAASVERDRRAYMNDTAEKKGPLANLQGEERLSHEKAGQASGLFESQLVGREMQSRRDEIAQALQLQAGMLSQDQQLAMQRELAQLDAGLRQQQINSGNDQFMGQLGLQSENQNNYWDAVRSGLL